MPILDDVQMDDDYFYTVGCTELLRNHPTEGASFGVKFSRSDGSVRRIDFVIDARPSDAGFGAEQSDQQVLVTGNAPYDGEFVFFVKLVDQNEDDPVFRDECTVSAGSAWWTAWRTIVDMQWSGERAVRSWLNLAENQRLKEFIEARIGPVWVEDWL